MLDEAYALVQNFQLAAGQPVSKLPVKLSRQRTAIRGRWMEEELREFLEAGDIYEQADALTDLLYYLLGTYVEMGVRPDTLFQIVHGANLSKLDSETGVIRSEDGKIQKPPEWRHPDAAIRAEIERMKATGLLNETSCGGT